MSGRQPLLDTRNALKVINTTFTVWANDPVVFACTVWTVFETTLQHDTYFQCSQPPAPPATRVQLVLGLQIRTGLKPKHRRLFLLSWHCYANNVLMHLHRCHLVSSQFSLFSLTTQSYEGFKKPYLIWSITTPGHVTEFRDSFVFPWVLHCTHCRSLSAPQEI